MRFRWEFSTPRKISEDCLKNNLGVSPLVAHLLIQRGLSDPDDAWRFLNPSISDLNDPYLMKDMGRVVERVFRSVDKRERVLVYGDYDVDGITSTVVLKRALEMLGAEVEYYIPRRLEEGYGVKTEVLRQAYDRGCRLVISVDNGIRAFEPVKVSRQIGLDFVITDHHPPDRTLPDAYAILNPNCSRCSYPDKNLAAVGVVFKLVQALFQKAGKEKVLKHFLKLVAIGTVADVVPLTGENRVIVWHGLRALEDPKNLGLRALLKAAGVKRELGFFDLGFKIAPRINAVTRMGGGREVVDLFSVKAESEAQRIVQKMNTKNLLRQEEERRILEEIETRFQRDPSVFQGDFLVVSGEKWHRGVIGIVASRLVDRFHRPVLVLSFEGEFGQGSGRSIEGFNLLKALDHCRHFFMRYGGHSQAVGCTLDPSFSQIKKLNKLGQSFQEYASSRLSPEQLIPSLRIESILRPKEISLNLCRDIEKLAPFGVGNPLPVFASEKLELVGEPRVLKNEHLKLRIQCNGSQVDAIWWRRGEFADRIKGVSQVNLAYTVSKDQYRGKEKLLLSIRDLRSELESN